MFLVCLVFCSSMTVFYAKCIRTLGVIEDREDHRMISLGMMHQPQPLLFQNLGLTLILRWPTISSHLLVECITRTTRLLIFLTASKIYMNRNCPLMLRCSPRPTFKFVLRLAWFKKSAESDTTRPSCNRLVVDRPESDIGYKTQ